MRKTRNLFCLALLCALAAGALLLLPSTALADSITFSPAAGVYNGPIEVTISCPGHDICYTTDGSLPIDERALYGSGVYITSPNPYHGTVQASPAMSP